MEEYIKHYLEKFSHSNTVFLTLALIIVFQMAMFFFSRKINKSTDSDDEKALNIKRVKSYGRALLIIAIFTLWFSQLQSVLVSMLAFAAAIVLAFKEVIMCITGGMLIRMNKSFVNGDRIEIDGIRGFVIGRTITGTRVLELGPEKNSQQTTGNVITIPNSIFLAKAAINQSYLQNYSIRTFTFSPPDAKEYKEAERHLLELANKISSDYMKKAKDSITRFCKKERIVIPAVEPRIKLHLSDDNELKFLLKMPVDNKRIGDIEQELYRSYYDYTVSRLQSGVKVHSSEGNESESK